MKFLSKNSYENNNRIISKIEFLNIFLYYTLSLRREVNSGFSKMSGLNFCMSKSDVPWNKVKPVPSSNGSTIVGFLPTGDSLRCSGSAAISEVHRLIENGTRSFLEATSLKVLVAQFGNALQNRLGCKGVDLAILRNNPPYGWSVESWASFVSNNPVFFNTLDEVYADAENFLRKAVQEKIARLARDTMPEEKQDQ